MHQLSHAVEDFRSGLSGYIHELPDKAPTRSRVGRLCTTAVNKERQYHLSAMGWRPFCANRQCPETHHRLRPDPHQCLHSRHHNALAQGAPGERWFSCTFSDMFLPDIMRRARMAMTGYLHRSWWILLLYGVIAVIFGVMALINPLTAGVALAWAFGIM